MAETGLTEVIPVTGGWQVKCAEHGLLFGGCTYPKERNARNAAGQHRSLHHGGAAGARPKVYRFTRDQLIDALTRLEAYPATSGDGKRTFIVAESMADAIIEALEEKPEPVHYRWPVVCGGQIPGTRWTGNLDRVTCAACCAITEERLASGKHD